MIAFADVHYRGQRATAAVLVAREWRDDRAAVERVVEASITAGYVPGELYRRELPPLLAVLATLPDMPGAADVIVVDGFATLGADRPGLGARLHDALDRRVPVVGVAKNAFAGADAIPVLRGSSARPLWVSAVGIDPRQAAEWIAGMHGRHRLPTLLVRADHLARGLASPAPDRARNVKTASPAEASLGRSAMSAQASRTLELLGHVQRNLDRDVSLAALASAARRDRFEVHRAFRRVVGETTKQYTSRLRLDRAAAEILSGGRTILEIAFASGFASHEVFARAFRRRFGISPRAYRGRGFAGAADRHSIAARHAAVVRAAAPCIGLYAMTGQDSRRNPMTGTVTIVRREIGPQPPS